MRMQSEAACSVCGQRNAASFRESAKSSVRKAHSTISSYVQLIRNASRTNMGVEDSKLGKRERIDI